VARPLTRRPVRRRRAGCGSPRDRPIPLAATDRGVDWHFSDVPLRSQVITAVVQTSPTRMVWRRRTGGGDRNVIVSMGSDWLRPSSRNFTLFAFWPSFPLRHPSAPATVASWSKNFHFGFVPDCTKFPGPSVAE